MSNVATHSGGCLGGSLRLFHTSDRLLVFQLGDERRDAPTTGGLGGGGTRSVAAEAARRIDLGELAEIERDNGLQGLAGRGLAQRFR
jgi:hypothetical protein